MSTAEILALRDRLDDVFVSLRNRFFYRPDSLVWGRLEHWESAAQIPDAGMIIGDCDAFALACRKACRHRGIEGHRLVECLTEKARRHLVLEVQGWVLDNRQDRVMARQQLPYHWLRMSGLNPNDPWRTVAG